MSVEIFSNSFGNKRLLCVKLKCFTFLKLHETEETVKSSHELAKKIDMISGIFSVLIKLFFSLSQDTLRNNMLLNPRIIYSYYIVVILIAPKIVS